MANKPQIGERVLYRGAFREIIGFKDAGHSARALKSAGSKIVMQNTENLKRTIMATADLAYDPDLKAWHGSGVELSRAEVALFSAAMGFAQVFPGEAHVQMLKAFEAKDPAVLIKALSDRQKDRLVAFCKAYKIDPASVIETVTKRRAMRAAFKPRGADARRVIEPHEVSGVLLQAKQKMFEAVYDFIADVVRVGLSTTTESPNFDTWDFVDDILEELTVGGYARQTLGSKAINEDAANDEQEFDSADPVFTALVTGETIGFDFLYKQTGGSDATPADDPLIAIHDLADTPTNGGNITLQVNTEGWWKLGGAPA
jgi:hypothetical protein